MGVSLLPGSEAGSVQPGVAIVGPTFAEEFRSTVEQEQALIRAEQEDKRLAKEAAAKQLREARRAAQGIRDRILRPMLASLGETFTQGKVLAHWEVKLADNGNQFSVLLTAQRDAGGTAKPGTGWGGKPLPDNDNVSICASPGPHGTWKRLSLRAVISVVDGGPALAMSVVWPKELGESHPVVNTKDIAGFHAGQCDDSAIALWYQTQLQDCARRCVRFAAEEQNLEQKPAVRG